MEAHGSDKSCPSSPLIEAVARGRCVLFLGADCVRTARLNWIRRDPHRARRRIGRRLSWVPATEAEITQAATAFLTQGPARGNIGRFVQEQVARATRPGLLHQHIVTPGLRRDVSAAYDDLTEQAMQEAGRHVFQVVGNAEIATRARKGKPSSPGWQGRSASRIRSC
jgi:hypothetical protein